VIEAGTEILLDTPFMTIDVTGSLTAQGTSAEPIVIRPNQRGQLCGDERGWWEGIKVSTFTPPGGTLQLDYTEVWYGQYGVRFRDGANGVIRDSVIRCSGQAGVVMEGSGTLLLEDTEVSNSRVAGVVVGAIVTLPSAVTIDGCDISFNGDTGLVVDLDDALQNVPVTVEYTKFELNAVHGILLARKSFPDIHYNHFFSNGVQSNAISSIFLADGYPNGALVTQLDATCNFFGAATASQATIDASIRDSLDSPGLVGTRVVTNPWLNESPLTTTPTCTPPSP
jgi:hypothetical protein